jgi:hypothetical protein
MALLLLDLVAFLKENTNSKFLLEILFYAGTRHFIALKSDPLAAIRSM